MQVPDDSALLHAQPYDPAKARDYYLRNRKLKGRNKGGKPDPLVRRAAGKSVVVKRKTGKSSEARRKEIHAQTVALEKRLANLKKVLATLVEKAKKRGGGETKKEKQQAAAEKATRAKNKGKPLTAKQKKEAAVRAKKAAAKDNAPPAEKLANLKEDLKEVRTKIQTALQEAKKKPSKTAPKGR